MKKQIISVFILIVLSSPINSGEFKSLQVKYIPADSAYSVKIEEKKIEPQKIETKTSYFKAEQIQYARVKNAYGEKMEGIQNELDSNGIRMDELQLVLLTFKAEQKIELWAKNKSDSVYKYIKSFDFCTLSGELGPKRRQGDRQVPEGFYYIDRFNPVSNYYLSLEVSYPNDADRILGYWRNLGGDIYIHGDCVSIGCIPITNEKIKELYVYALEAKNNGQENIPVYMFPEQLTDSNFEELKQQFAGRQDLIEFWKNLKEGYDKFQAEQKELNVIVNEKGRYIF